MAKINGAFSKKVSEDSVCLKTIERMKMRRKLFRLTAYKLTDGETVITTRQMVIAVKNKPYMAKEFMRRMKIRPIQVQMPNGCVTDMVPVSVVLVFWKYLNESGKGNYLTRIGQKYLDEYLSGSLQRLRDR